MGFWPQHYEPIELIGRCLLEVRIEFSVAYSKRAQKLLVGRSQTLLIYFIFVLIIVFVCGPHIYNFVSKQFSICFNLFLICFSCLCGFSSTDLSIYDFFKKHKDFCRNIFPRFSKSFPQVISPSDSLPYYTFPHPRATSSFSLCFIH